MGASCGCSCAGACGSAVEARGAEAPAERISKNWAIKQQPQDTNLAARVLLGSLQIAAAHVGGSFVPEHHSVAPHVDFVFAAIFCALASVFFAGSRPAVTFPECAFKIWNTH